MDKLATQLSFLSFAIIGVIVLIGVYQKRSWLEMFTIGGECGTDRRCVKRPRLTLSLLLL